MIYHLLLAGGDQRARELMPLLEKKGYQVETLGLWNEDERRVQIEKADALLFPYPFSVKKGLVPTMSGLSLHPEDVLGAAKRDAVVLMGKGLAPYIGEAKRTDEKVFTALAYEEDEAFPQKNADISAEATVHHVMGLGKKALFHLRVLVVGYGKYGRATAKRLKALGADVTVAARRETQRLLAASEGMRAVSIGELALAASKIEVLLNTVPAQVIGGEVLKQLPMDCALLELASAPYGFDRALAEELGLHCEVLPGLPARYAPKSAAMALLEASVTLLTEAER